MRYNLLLNVLVGVFLNFGRARRLYMLTHKLCGAPPPPPVKVGVSVYNFDERMKQNYYSNHKERKKRPFAEAVVTAIRQT